MNEAPDRQSDALTLSHEQEWTLDQRHAELERRITHAVRSGDWRLVREDTTSAELESTAEEQQRSLWDLVGSKSILRWIPVLGSDGDQRRDADRASQVLEITVDDFGVPNFDYHDASAPSVRRAVIEHRNLLFMLFVALLFVIGWAWNAIPR